MNYNMTKYRDAAKLRLLESLLQSTSKTSKKGPWVEGVYINGSGVRVTNSCI